MSVYNAQKYIEYAINSILNQTLSDFEFIIINDGSTDSTSKILDNFRDERLTIIHQENKGIAFSLNKGIKLSKGIYIARMDADDISEPTRLEKQIKILEKNPTIAVVGCWHKIIDEMGNVLCIQRIPEFHDDLRKLLKKENILCHGSVMFRKDTFKYVRGYDEGLLYAQDYDLWLRILNLGYKFYAIQEPLYRYRISPDSIAKAYLQRRYAAIIRRNTGRINNYMGAKNVSSKCLIKNKQKIALYQYAIGTIKLNNNQAEQARSYFIKSIKLNIFSLRPWYRLALSLLPLNFRRFISSYIVHAVDFFIRSFINLKILK